MLENTREFVLWYILFATLVSEVFLSTFSLSIHFQKTCACSGHFVFAFFFQGDSLITVCKYRSGREMITVGGVSDRLTPYLLVVTLRPIILHTTQVAHQVCAYLRFLPQATTRSRTKNIGVYNPSNLFARARFV